MAFGDKKLFLSIEQRKRMFGKYWDISRDFVPGTKPAVLEEPPLTTPPITRGGEGYIGVYKRLDNLQGMILNTRIKLGEHIDKSKPRLKDGF